MWAVEHETGAFLGLVGYAEPEGWPAEPAAVVSQAFWRNRLGGAEHLILNGTRVTVVGVAAEVIGIVGDARYASPTEPPAPHFYLYRRFRDRAGLTTAFSISLWGLCVELRHKPTDFDNPPT